MRGHDDLIRVRRQGVKPNAMVFINDMQCSNEWLRWLEHGHAPTICTHGDDLKTLDLRFLVGLQVSVAGADLKRVRELSKACKVAGAEMIVASCGERLACWKKGDATWLSS